MPWDKDNEDAFPARHSREPGGLRQDILDEIADHLACATEREQERDTGGNEETVWNRVLDKFGDPNTIARRLWWDQMRETVMREWIQTGVMIVVGLAVVVFMAVVVRQMNTANQTVLEALRSNVVAVNPLASFTVKVTRGTEGGTAVSGAKITVAGPAFGEASDEIERMTDASGTAVFGPFQPGSYYVHVLRDPLSGMQMESEKVTCFAGELDLVAQGVMGRFINGVLCDPEGTVDDNVESSAV